MAYPADFTTTPAAGLSIPKCAWVLISDSGLFYVFVEDLIPEWGALEQLDIVRFCVLNGTLCKGPEPGWYELPKASQLRLSDFQR